MVLAYNRARLCSPRHIGVDRLERFQRTQMSLSVGLKNFSGLSNGRAKPDRRQDIVQRLAVGQVKQHVTRGHERQIRLLGKVSQPVSTVSVVRTSMEFREEIRLVEDISIAVGVVSGKLFAVRRRNHSRK